MSESKEDLNHLLYADEDKIVYEDDYNSDEDDFKKNVTITSSGHISNIPKIAVSLKTSNATKFIKTSEISRYSSESMYVAESGGRNGDNKFSFCLFCYKKQKNIARHLELIHPNEDEVRKFLSLPKGSLKRRTSIGNLRKKGNLIFNTNAKINDRIEKTQSRT